ncbi:MarR family transcriptional regulator [Pseudonocardia sp.]|uniref:MarR family winged helix-turn-helix transcriptional regulator n=1 Tax=Pseudonocardia sp. TaxID=60912 RepID=UPI00261C5CD7|nr:MarR family transcriptional regulator [Pseudonocardia sp.]
MDVEPAGTGTGTGTGEPELELLDPRVRYQVERARAEHGPDFDALPLSLTLLLHRVTAMLVKASSLDIEPLGLTTAQFNVLTVLHRAERPMTMTQLAETLSIRPPNLTTLVDMLRGRGLVAKTVSRADRRSFRVVTTAEGDALMADFLPGHWRFMSEFYAGLDAAGQRTLATHLDRLLATLHNGEGSAEIASNIVAAACDDG